MVLLQFPEIKWIIFLRSLIFVRFHCIQLDDNSLQIWYSHFQSLLFLLWRMSRDIFCVFPYFVYSGNFSDVSFCINCMSLLFHCSLFTRKMYGYLYIILYGYLYIIFQKIFSKKSAFAMEKSEVVLWQLFCYFYYLDTRNWRYYS